MQPIKYERHVFQSPNDAAQSMLLTTLQRHNQENILRNCVEEKVNMSSEEPGYLLKQEFLRGQITMLQYLLALDDGVRAPENSDT